MLKVEQQINQVKESMETICKQHGIDPKILQAQTFVETGYLKHVIENSNNLFNIKWKGKGQEKKIEKEYGICIDKVKTQTREFYNNEWITESTYFRSYSSYEDSIKDYIYFVKNRYPKIMVYRQNPQMWYKTLYNNGYATDPNYVEKNMKMYERINYFWYDRSELVKIIQKMVDQYPDGYYGEQTIKKVDNFLQNKYKKGQDDITTLI